MKQEHPQFALALVTGASSGIGRALCHLLADRGINLIISGRDRSRLEATASELRDKVHVVTVYADMANIRDRGVLVEYIRTHVPDLIVNNAGYGLYGDALSFETKEQLDILEVDGNAVLELTLEGAKSMISHHKKGVILNVSSAAGVIEAMPGMSVYSATKAFVNHMSESLDFETKPHGVRILASCPGMVNTGFRERASRGYSVSKGHGTMTPKFAASQILWQIDSLTPFYIFNWKYRLGTFLARYLVPKKLVAKFLKSSIQDRYAARNKPILKK